MVLGESSDAHKNAVGRRQQRGQRHRKLALVARERLALGGRPLGSYFECSSVAVVCKRGTLPGTVCLDLVTRGKIIVRTMWTHVIRPGLCRSPGGTVDIRHPCYAAERSYRNPTTSRCCPCLARSATAVRRVSAGGGDGDGDGEVAADGWGCGACTRRWVGIYTHDVHRRWGSVFWRSWARVIRGRLPVIGRPNADILHHGPPPAYAHGREAVCWRGRPTRRGRRQVHPGRRRARGTRGGRPVSSARRTGGYRLR
jgi:hypothetical protein